MMTRDDVSDNAANARYAEDTVTFLKSTSDLRGSGKESFALVTFYYYQGSYSPPENSRLKSLEIARLFKFRSCTVRSFVSGRGISCLSSSNGNRGISHHRHSRGRQTLSHCATGPQSQQEHPLRRQEKRNKSRVGGGSEGQPATYTSRATSS